MRERFFSVVSLACLTEFRDVECSLVSSWIYTQSVSYSNVLFSGSPDIINNRIDEAMPRKKSVWNKTTWSPPIYTPFLTFLPSLYPCPRTFGSYRGRSPLPFPRFPFPICRSIRGPTTGLFAGFFCVLPTPFFPLTLPHIFSHLFSKLRCISANVSRVLGTRSETSLFSTKRITLSHSTNSPQRTSVRRPVFSKFSFRFVSRLISPSIFALRRDQWSESIYLFPLFAPSTLS